VVRNSGIGAEVARQIIVRRIAPEDWPQTSRRFRDLTYEQSLTYGLAAAARIGAEAEFVVLEEPDASGGRIVGAACIRIKRVPVLGRGIAWIVAGPLIEPLAGPVPKSSDLHDLLAALRAHVHSAGHTLRLRLAAISGIDLEAVAQAAAQAGFVVTQRAPGYHTAAFDLSLSEEALFKALHGKWRNPLRNALKVGLEIDIGPISAMSERFARLYEDVRDSKGFQSDIGPDFFYALNGPDFSHNVLVVHRDGRDLAGFSIAWSGNRATYLFGATTEAGRKVNAGHFVMWKAALYCAEEGLSWLDLGGISQQDNPSVARFKRRTGARALIAAGPFEAVAPGAVSWAVLQGEALRKHLKGKP
jgi:hypothetical protein